VNTEGKLYYVTGKDFYGNPRTVKTYARNPRGARWNAGFVLATPGRVKRG
jgi:hypothetical protein